MATVVASEQLQLKTVSTDPSISNRMSRQSKRSSAKSSENIGSLLSVKKSRSRRQAKTLYWTISPPEPSVHMDCRRWHDLQLELAQLNLEENQSFFDNAGRYQEPKPIVDAAKAFDLVLSRYVKYCMIVKKLDDCYAHLQHPQKRLLLKSCLGAAVTRILELKDELVQIDQREYQFLEDILQELGITHSQVELQIPLFVRQERTQVLKKREKLLSVLYDNTSLLASSSQTSHEPMTRSDAVCLIQRQTRYYLGNIKAITARNVYRPLSPTTVHALERSAIDRWLMHASIRDTGMSKRKIDKLLGMMSMAENQVRYTRRKSSGSALKSIANNSRKTNKNEENFQKDQAFLKNEILTKEGPYMAWNLHQNIKQWLIEVRDILGKFPPFPDEEEGGSTILFANRELQDVSDELDINVVNGKVTYPKVEKPKKQKKVKKYVKPSPWGPDGFEYVLDETDCMRMMNACTTEYKDYWYCKDDSSNLHQVHDRELLKEQLRPMVAEEIRLQVDELIRAELEQLIYAIDRDPKPVPDKKKKPKKEKGKGGKKEKDPTADRTIEELHEELVQQGIIRFCKSAALEDFLGEHSLTGTLMDQQGKDPMPSLADVKRMAIEFAMLPLSSKEIHENAPLIRKLLIAGVRGTGKKLLVRAICHEIGATFFDLTPTNLQGKYDSPQGIKMLMHLIMKVGKAMEPSIFWVGECEKLFLKKKDKTDPAKPHQWAGHLNKTFKKGIKNGDMMMLIGTTNMPGLTKQGPFNKFFDRIIIVPQPDYPSRYLAWNHFITKQLHNPIPGNFDLSALTKISAGFTIASIENICGRVVTEERKQKLKYRALETDDFVNIIWGLEPIYVEEQEFFLDWYANTPLAKLRQARIHPEEETTSGKKK